MIAGIVLAAVAVILLAVAGFLLLGGDDNSAAPNSNNSFTQIGNTTNPGQNNTGPNPTPVNRDGIDLAEPSNHLPNDVDLVVDIRLGRVLSGGVVGTMLFGADGVVKDLPTDVENRLGLRLTSIDRVLVGGNQKENWLLFIVRAKEPIAMDAVKKAMGLKPAGNPIRGQEYFVKTSTWRESVNRVMGLPAEGNAKPTPLAVRLHDKQTLVMGDLKPVEKFLQDLGHPKASGSASNNDPTLPPEGAPPPGVAPPPDAGPPPGAPPPDAGAPPPDGAVPPPDSGIPVPDSGFQQKQSTTPYSTLEPRFQTVLSRLNRKENVMVCAVVDLARSKVKDLLPPVIAPKLLGLSIHGNVGTEIGIECADRKVAVAVRDQLKKKLEEAQSEFDPLRIALAWPAPKTRQNTPPGAIPPEGVPPGEEPPGQAPPPPPGVPPGVFPPGQLPPGVQPPGQFPPEEQPGQPILPRRPIDLGDEEPIGTIEISGPTASNALVYVGFKTKPEVLELLFMTYALPHVLRVKGEKDMALKAPSPHDLGLAGQRYLHDHKAFPRGTLPRKLTDDRYGRPWLPDERISGLADLLPYLGYSDLRNEIDPDKSWRDKKNVKASMTLVPFFISPSYAPATRYVDTGDLNPAAATHFVGLAGIGLDAADYPADDPTLATKRGIWGYDRTTNVADLVDNLATTIFMIQIPAEYRGPWLAGGGATVRGVPEKNSIQPFVATQYNGRAGTFAVMADGSVRFIAGDISDDVFKALAAVKKDPEKVQLESVPLVPPPDKPELRTRSADR
ncbi:MAG: hypothetical protein KatS3mg105_3232 [Gemmatales bacterium]|nr:MAG: hypothetical protein KatS3mg105_3232 [Gemmatales bacterium]